MKKPMLAALALLLGASTVSLVPVQAETTAQGIEQYREMLNEGGNPADLIVMTGDDLWHQKRGPKQASLENATWAWGPASSRAPMRTCPAISRMRAGSWTWNPACCIAW